LFDNRTERTAAVAGPALRVAGRAVWSLLVSRVALTRAPTGQSVVGLTTALLDSREWLAHDTERPLPVSAMDSDFIR